MGESRAADPLEKLGQVQRDFTNKQFFGKLVIEVRRTCSALHHCAES
jgi:hypothetical protein